MNTSTPCPICNNGKVQVLLQGGDENSSPDVFGSSRKSVTHGQILRCDNCGFGFRKVRPSEEELYSLYRKLDDEIYESETVGRSITAYRHLQILHQYLSGGLLLDVGCASGFFLELAALAGWQTVGIEPSESSCSKAKERLEGQGEVICTSLQKAELPQLSFDVITLWDVLEHVPDPIQVLRKCRTLLKPGGYLIVNVPNLNSLQAKIFGSRWPLFLNEHLNYFSKKSLRICGERCDLDLIQYRHRLASFSIGYVLYRLIQHRIPASSQIYSLGEKFGYNQKIISLPLGELIAIFHSDLSS